MNNIHTEKKNTKYTTIIQS